MTAIDVIAGDFTAMLRAGRFEDAGEKYWASDVVSIEPADLPGGIRASVTGIDAARIDAAAREYLGSDNLVIVVVGDRRQIDSQGSAESVPA